MKLLFSISFVLLFALFGPAQTGKVLESLEFESKIVSYPVKYSIYLPPDYYTSERSYPVLYLLHGYSDDETGWIQFGEANSIADKAINSGDATSCIIVMPDGKVAWYTNSVDGKDRWEDMFTNEFIPSIEKKYRIRSKKEFRAIAGLSMGGWETMETFMAHPDMFSYINVMSAGWFIDNKEMFEQGDKRLSEIASTLNSNVKYFIKKYRARETIMLPH